MIAPKEMWNKLSHSLLPDEKISFGAVASGIKTEVQQAVN
jgi:hypothetical protein